MKHRHVFCTTSVAQAAKAVRAATGAGVLEDDIYLVARSDIEVHQVRDRRKMADSDFIPAAIRGAIVGMVVGFLISLGLALFWHVDPRAMLFGAGMGAAVGGLASSLMGAAIPDPIRRRFEKEIDDGKVLVVVDAGERELPGMERAMAASDAVKLPYEAPSAMT